MGLLTENVIFSWSGGKDSALGLHKVMLDPQYEVVCLLTSISEPYQRISMHGVRVDLLEAQAKSIGIPLIKMLIPEMPSMEVYETGMRSALSDLKEQGATACVFGDIFLEDLRQYRESKLRELDLKGIFPLWKIPTDKLIREFIDLGFKTIITCVNEKYLDKSFAGRIIDDDFLNDLPYNVDPCGENGEFHTFVFDGPVFKEPVPFVKGEVVYRTYSSPDPSGSSSGNNRNETPTEYGFWYCDLIL